MTVHTHNTKTTIIMKHDIIILLNGMCMMILSYIIIISLNQSLSIFSGSDFSYTSFSIQMSLVLLPFSLVPFNASGFGELSSWTFLPFESVGSSGSLPVVHSIDTLLGFDLFFLEVKRQ